MIHNTQKILIVDDDTRMCDSLRLLLNSHDLEVFTAISGHQALDLLSGNDFDLAILDIILPDMNGGQLMEHIHVSAPDTVVIIITGHATLSAAVKALQMGAYDYLRKPFEPDRLLNTVKNALKQKRLKCENIATNRKLAHSEERYRLLIQDSPDIIYTLDEQNQFTFISEAVERLLGFQIVELIGRHFTTVVYEDDQDKANQLLEEKPGYRNPSAIELRFNVRGNQKKSKFCEVKHIPYEGKTTDRIHLPAMKKGKRNFYIYGVARDISNSKQFELELLQAQKMEAIGTLAGGIAHDFNNLLMGIQGHVSLMLLDFDTQHRYYQTLKTIEQCVQSGADLTRQILDFARDRGGKHEVVSTDLNEIIENSLSMFGRTQKEVQTHSVLQEGIWAVGVDRIKIQQVMINICINAWQAMPEGGTLIIETKNVELDQNDTMAFGVEPGKYVKVSVTDTGIGMDPATQKRIFEPYFTTKTMDKGSGLGLATVYGIIKDHGGTIEVHSEKGKGTSFNIFLPASENSGSGETETSGAIFNGEGTILLVDDENLILDVGRQFLEYMGYKVLLAGGGKKAVEIYKNNRDKIQLVILDLIMPDMGGRETYDALKSINPNVKVLISSGYTVDDLTNELSENGIDGYIQKPFKMADLSRGIRNILSYME